MILFVPKENPSLRPGFDLFRVRGRLNSLLLVIGDHRGFELGRMYYVLLLELSFSLRRIRSQSRALM